MRTSILAVPFISLVTSVLVAGCAVDTAPDEAASSGTAQAVVSVHCDPGYAPSCSIVRGKRVCTCEPIDPPTPTSCLDVPPDLAVTGSTSAVNESADYNHGAVCDRRVGEVLFPVSKTRASVVGAPNMGTVTWPDQASCESTHFEAEIYGLAVDGWHTLDTRSETGRWHWSPLEPCFFFGLQDRGDLSPYGQVRIAAKMYRTNPDGSTTPLPVYVALNP